MPDKISTVCLMIQDIFPHRFNNQYIANLPIGENDFVLHYHDNSLLMKTDGEALELPRKSDFPEITKRTESTFLFTLDDVPCFLVWDDLKVDYSLFTYQEISFFRTIEQPEIAWVSIAGFHLMNWYTQNRFCGKCGSRTEHKSNERAVVCPNCHITVYPKISPAIIVAIVSGDKLLLARNANFRGNWFSLVAGYVDVGETLEEALAREVKEEVGLDVTNIQYYKSQPWPLSGSMMIGFVAEADEHQPIRVDGNEIAEAAWFSRGHLPNHSSTISIAGEMIAQFEKGELQGCGEVKKVRV
ncbi:NAD(+) diphosphatase [Prolixibacter bellariivorans]|nr:NAD(+) diphosphatase [Prolixibacter bellariivorans]